MRDKQADTWLLEQMRLNYLERLDRVRALEAALDNTTTLVKDFGVLTLQVVENYEAMIRGAKLVLDLDRQRLALEGIEVPPCES